MKKGKMFHSSKICQLIFLTCAFFLGNKLEAQENSSIDEKRETISNINDSLVKLSNHIYAILSDGEAGNIAIYVNNDGLVLVDDQWVELVPKIKTLLATISEKPVKYIINTHFHYDHTDGNKVLGKEGAIIISHDNIRKRLAEKQVLALSNLIQEPYPFEGLPFITFSESLTLNEPNEKIKIIHVKNAHTDGDSFIKFVNSNVIHTGDVFVRYGFPYIDDNNGGNIYGLIEAIDILIGQSNEKTLIIPGHGQISTKEDLKSYKNMLQTVVSRIEQGVKNNLTEEQIQNQNPLKNLNLPWEGAFNLKQIINMVKTNLNFKQN